MNSHRILLVVLAVTLLISVVSGSGPGLAPRPTATDTMPTLNESYYVTLQEIFNSSGNETANISWSRIIYLAPKPFSALLGPFAYLIIGMIPFMMLWIRQSSTLVPLTLALICGGFVLGFIPPEYVLFSGAMVALGILAIVFGLVKKRS